MVSREVLEQVEDDIQMRIDSFFDKLSGNIAKEARFFKERELRKVFVDHPHVPAKVIQEIYARLLKEALDSENMSHLWGKYLKND